MPNSNAIISCVCKMHCFMQRVCVCVCGKLCTVSHGGANRAQHRWTLTDTSVLLQPTASLSAETQYIRASADASADAANSRPVFFSVPSHCRI